MTACFILILGGFGNGSIGGIGSGIGSDSIVLATRM
jgi:hypothetical protein